jgi:hypothetical protein
MALVTVTRLGSYEIDCVIGAGGKRSVREADDVRPSRVLTKAPESHKKAAR